MAGADSPSATAPGGPPRELLGDLDGPVAAADRSGTITVLGATWGVGWAVGAGDRWHVAAEEAAVRTRLVDGMPVLATAMRVTGGDVVQRAAVVRDRAGRGVVLEFVNETPAPVSLALAVSGSVSRAQVRGSRLTADGHVALELDRAPRGAAAVSGGSVWEAVKSGPPAGDCTARSRSGLAAAAVLVPLSSGIPLRVTMPIAGELAEVRPPEQVASGWLSLVSRAGSVSLPDETAELAWSRGIAACILAAGGADIVAASRAAVVLDRVGLADEADRGRDTVLQALTSSGLPPTGASAALLALASRRLRAGRVSGLAEWAGPLVEAAGDGLEASTLEQVATALESEAPAAARDARRLLAETAPRPPFPDPEAAADRLSAAIRDSVAFGGEGLAGIEAVLECLADETADGVVMAPVLPAAWRGAPVDARSIVTRYGTLSYSVRWHGPRPALLWELAPADPLDPAGDRGGPVLRCGLDESWTSTMPAGEALLRSHEP